jgi:hypothetical protein
MNSTNPLKSKINRIHPKINIYIVLRLSLAQNSTTNARANSKAISLPLDLVINVPARPTNKKKTDRILDSRLYNKVCAEIIAMMGQITGIGATPPPKKRNPVSISEFRTRLELKNNVRKTITNNISAISRS